MVLLVKLHCHLLQVFPFSGEAVSGSIPSTGILTPDVAIFYSTCYFQLMVQRQDRTPAYALLGPIQNHGS